VQSITYDEAFTYFRFLSGAPSRVFTRYNSNNHVLFSVLARGALALFGASELTLRLPSVLAAVVYFGTVWMIAHAAFGSGPLFGLTVAALTLNPLILDLLVAARGYALALALYSLAMYLLARNLVESAPSARRLIVPSALLGLSVAANLTFLFAALALVATVMALQLRRARTAQPFDFGFAQAAITLALPGILTAAVLLAVPLWHSIPNTFSYGTASLWRSLQSLIEMSFQHDRGAWPPGPERLPPTKLALVLVWTIVLPTAIAAITIATRDFLNLRAAQIAASLWLQLAIGSLMGSILLMIAAHVVFAVPYPFGRTAVSLLFLFIAAAAFLAGRLLRSAAAAATLRASGAVLVVLMLAATARYTAQLQTSYFYDWRFDAGSRQVFDIIANWPVPSDGRRLRVATSPWLFAPSLNFYRTMRRATHVEEIVDGLVNDLTSYDFIVLSAEVDLSRAQQFGRVLWVHPVSGAVLLVTN